MDPEGNLDQPSSQPCFASSTEITFGTSAASLEKKFKHAGKIIVDVASRLTRGNPLIITADTSEFLVTELFKYSGMEDALSSEKIKGEDALTGMIGAMRWVYKRAGRKSAWKASPKKDGSTNATGNPFVDNANIEHLKWAHKKKVAELGLLTRCAPPLTAEWIVDHAKTFWLRRYEFNLRDAALHAIFLVALNCGLRYAKVERIKMTQVSVTKHGVTFAIAEKTKNSVAYNEYVLKHWPGNHFSKVLVMDPFFAVSAWLEVRGDADGYLFCAIDGHADRQRLRHYDPWSNKDFVVFMRRRFINLGMARERAKMFIGHGLKRGCVQLLRTLGVKDEEIMRWINMEGAKAYLSYAEAFNDVCPPLVPDFRGLKEVEAHTIACHRRTKTICNSSAFSFIDEWISKEVTDEVDTCSYR